MATADSYNIDTYYRSINDDTRAAFPRLPLRVGSAAPPFSLPLVGGGKADLQSLLDTGHLVLIFGCFTAPPCVAQLPALESHFRTYSGRGISFLFIYTREIHPGENFPPHRTMEQKLAQAERMRDHARITFPVAADALDGTVHEAYGGLPSMTTVVHHDGTVIYRGSWTQAAQIRDVLENLLLRDRDEAAGTRGRLAYSEWISYMEHEADENWALLDVAGPKARADYEQANAEGGPRYRI
jgi:hypothetical protein